MRKSRFGEGQIIGVLKEVESGHAGADVSFHACAVACLSERSVTGSLSALKNRALRVGGLASRSAMAADGKIHQGTTHGIRLAANHGEEGPGRPGRHHARLLPFLYGADAHAKIWR